jgi:ABC-type transport system involved in multi-copper enzyme maturation permease subunit
MGRAYGALLTLQLMLDFFVVVFALLLLVWPRGGAVALAAFAEGVRQPMFWLLTIIGLVVMLILPILPYFTFGEDLKMVKELGYDTIIFLAGLFAVLAASMSISEEIEGRTAVTLMSKPVSRRQFLLGKFFGILLAALLMTALLALAFFLIVWFKPVYDREEVSPPGWIQDARFFIPELGQPVNAFWAGILWWFADTMVIAPGVILGFCQVMVLLAIAVALATRLPMVVNVPVCSAIFFLGHLSPILSQVSQQRGTTLLRFVAQLFDALLPGLDYFNIGPALTRDPLPEAAPFALYVTSVGGYALVYTAIALLFGLILFEDRDLA